MRKKTAFLFEWMKDFFDFGKSRRIAKRISSFPAAPEYHLIDEPVAPIISPKMNSRALFNYFDNIVELPSAKKMRESFAARLRVKENG